MGSVNRIGPYELGPYRVDNLPAYTDVNGYVDIERFCFENGITPQGFILGPDITTPAQGYANFQHCAKAGPAAPAAIVPMATTIIHAGALKGYYTGGTTASSVYIVGFSA